MRIRPNFPEEAHSIKHTAGHHGAPKIRRGHVYMYDVYVNIERETYIETYYISYIYSTCTVYVFMYTLCNHFYTCKVRKIGKKGECFEWQLWP